MSDIYCNLSNVTFINEEPLADIERKQRSITRLFPTFYDRVKKIPSIHLYKEVPGVWTFKAKSASEVGKEYDVVIEFSDLALQIAGRGKDMNLWTSDKSRIDLVKIAREIFDDSDLKISCSCLTGDTKIPLLDGRNLSLEEIYKEFDDKEFWIYSSDENGDFVPARARSLGVTNYVSEILEVVLDNGESIKCTFDHLFRLRNGNYVKADSLAPGDSLMPLYKELSSGGYEYVKLNSKRKWMSTYQMVGVNILKDDLKKIWSDAKDKGENKVALHHKDGSKINNDPANLKWMTFKDHWRYHASLGTNRLKKTWEWMRDPKNKEILSKRNRKAGLEFARQRLDCVKKFNEIGVSRMKALATPKLRSDPEAIKEFRRQRAVEMNKTLLRDCAGRNNHTVLKIIKIQYDNLVPVYDLSVNEYHNFALSAGVFVHNCPASLYWGPEYIQTKRQSHHGDDETRPPKIRNPKEYGMMCKHLQFVIDHFPFYKSTLARHLKRFYSKDIEKVENKVKSVGKKEVKKEEPDKDIKNSKKEKK